MKARLSGGGDEASVGVATPATRAHSAVRNDAQPVHAQAGVVLPQPHRLNAHGVLGFAGHAPVVAGRP